MPLAQKELVQWIHLLEARKFVPTLALVHHLSQCLESNEGSVLRCCPPPRAAACESEKCNLVVNSSASVCIGSSAPQSTLYHFVIPSLQNFCIHLIHHFFVLCPFILNFGPSALPFTSCPSTYCRASGSCYWAQLHIAHQELWQCMKSWMHIETTGSAIESSHACISIGCFIS